MGFTHALCSDDNNSDDAGYGYDDQGLAVGLLTSFETKGRVSTETKTVG